MRFVLEPQVGNGPPAAAVTIEVEPSPRPPVLAIDRRLAPTDAGRLVTGDAAFDRAVFVSADDPTLLGLFDAGTRAEVMAFIAAGGAIAAGVLRIGPRAVAALAAGLEPVVRRMIALGQRLSVERGNLVAAVIEMIEGDPDAAVRAQAIAAFGDDAAVRQAMAQRNGGDAGLRTSRLAARVRDAFAPDGERAGALDELIQSLQPALAGAGEERRKAIGILAELARVESLSSGLQLSIIAALGATSDEAAGEVLAELCNARAEAVFVAALTTLGGLDLPAERRARLLSPGTRERATALAPLHLASRGPASDLLAALFLLVEPRAVGLRKSYVAALTRVGDRRHAGLVASELESPDEANRLEAIRALAVLGGPRELALLEPLCRGFLRSGEIKSAARSAVQALRARLDDDLVGAMTYAEHAGGELSMSERSDG
ncbi:MAG: hypothetical protein U1F43_27080 [Myxococcota bacterium]